MRWTCWIAARIAARTSDLDADGEVVWSWSPDAETKLRGTIRAMKGQQSPVPGESAKDTVKTIAQGMPDDPAEPCMGSKLSRERRLLGAIFGAEVRRGQGWPKATAGGGASAALSATNSAR